MGTTHIIHIHGRHSPPPRLDLTLATHHMQQRQHGTAEILRQKHKLPTRLARDHPFGEGHEQASSFLGSEQGIEQGQLARHEAKALQHHPEQSQHTEIPAETWHDTWTSRVNHTDTDTHSTHTAPPTPRLPHHDGETKQNPLNEKYWHNESAPRSARYHPLGEGHGLTGTVFGLVQGSEQDMQSLAKQKLQMQTLHPVRGREETPHFQAWTQQKALIYTQVAQAAEDTRLNTAEQAQGGLLAEGCGRMTEFLAQAAWNEKRKGLGATHPGIEQHLHSHNSICHHLTLMLEELPAEAIPTAEGKKLQQLHRILQLSRMPDWPGECLQPEISTPGFDVVISEIAEFETLRLGFLSTIKETILTVYDKLTNPNMTESTNHLTQLAHLLDIKPALTWIQYILPEELTHSTLQLATFQTTFGSLGEIAEIFLFEPRPEGFIIFYGSLQISNFDGILSPQHCLIMIKNPSHPSLPICSTAAPHYPTRRPAIGTLVTLSSQGRGRHEATVVAIQQNYWPRKWRYMIRIEEIGKFPELLMTVLDRGILNSQDMSTCISPKAVILTDGDVAVFFNEFERLIQVTIIQKGSPGFYETVRMVQPLQAHLSPRMKLLDIENHRLFTADMCPSSTANPR